MSDSSWKPPAFTHPDLFETGETPLGVGEAASAPRSLTAALPDPHAFYPPVAGMPCKGDCGPTGDATDGYCEGCRTNMLKLWFSGLVFAWDTSAGASARQLRHETFA